MKRAAFLFIFVLIAQTLTVSAQSESSNEMLLQISSIPEAKLDYTHTIKYPFLQGDSPLTEGNNIRISLTAEISPVMLNGLIKTVWTPVAFIELSAGVRLGTGWPINILGEDIYGTGLNFSGIDGKSEYKGSTFDALLWKGFAGGTFQFDLAAIFPGDWNHVVFLTYHEINYQANTNAKKWQSWYYEGDYGENCNGFNYYGNFVIGYQMPIFLNMIAFLTEMDLYLYDTPNRSAWGDDMIRWKFSGILNFTITKKLEIAVITQFRTWRNFIEPDWEDLYYRNRTIDTSNPLKLEFYRIAAAITYRF